MKLFCNSLKEWGGEWMEKFGFVPSPALCNAVKWGGEWMELTGSQMDTYVTIQVVRKQVSSLRTHHSSRMGPLGISKIIFLVVIHLSARSAQLKGRFVTQGM